MMIAKSYVSCVLGVPAEAIDLELIAVHTESDRVFELYRCKNDNKYYTEITLNDQKLGARAPLELIEDYFPEHLDAFNSSNSRDPDQSSV